MREVTKTNDFREELISKASRIIVERIAKEVINDPDLFSDLYTLTFDSDNKVSWRALWACNKICELQPDFFKGKHSELTKRVLTEQEAGKMRLMLNILLNMPQPEEINVELLDFCIENMTALNQTSACQAVCMKLAYKMCKSNQPELLNEIKIYIENMEVEYYNAAVISTRNSILKELKRK